ncbi:MAG: hypothetical protein V7K53_31015 [Nostoc sp.]|uniref:hypothetical protein n=1 Tax=Nostoc sp. TaxID=1180 RepID=UPI002FFA68D3
MYIPQVDELWAMLDALTLFYILVEAMKRSHPKIVRAALTIPTKLVRLTNKSI